MRAKDGLGIYGENVAVAHLVGAGFTILDRNWRCEIGEIDIVARDGSTLVVCEVKTRSSTRFGVPLEAVTPRKAARLRRLAARWLQDQSVRRESVRPDEVRIDLVGVLRSDRGAAHVDHVRGVTS